MPKLTRKYPTTQKTTTPEGMREYRRLQQKDYRINFKLKNNVELKELKHKIVELQKTINLMRTKFEPDLPLIKIELEGEAR